MTPKYVLRIAIITMIAIILIILFDPHVSLCRGLAFLLRYFNRILYGDTTPISSYFSLIFFIHSNLNRDE